MFGGDPLQLSTFDIARSTKKKLNVEKGIILKLFGSSEKIRDGIMHSITQKNNSFYTVTEKTVRIKLDQMQFIFWQIKSLVTKNA